MSKPTLPPGSRILLTGVNGYIASHIADQLLHAGYIVRGTARTQDKFDGIKKVLLEMNPSAQLEAAVVPDLTAKGAFDELIKDCSAIIHTATDASLSPDPHIVVPTVVNSITSLLSAAAATPSVRRFVYTSSSVAAVEPVLDKAYHIDSSSWNQVSVPAAYSPIRPDEPSPNPVRSFDVYKASKILGEQAVWDFVKTNKPSFVVNCVLPNLTTGPILDENAQHGSTAGWIKAMSQGSEQWTEMYRTAISQYMVDVRDVARLHVAALLEEDVQGERILAFGERLDYVRLVAALKKIFPEGREYPEPFHSGVDESTVATERPVELLKRMGRPGFIGLEESLRDQLTA